MWRGVDFEQNSNNENKGMPQLHCIANGAISQVALCNKNFQYELYFYSPQLIRSRHCAVNYTPLSFLKAKRLCKVPKSCFRTLLNSPGVFVFACGVRLIEVTFTPPRTSHSPHPHHTHSDQQKFVHKGQLLKSGDLLELGVKEGGTVL